MHMTCAPPTSNTICFCNGPTHHPSLPPSNPNECPSDVHTCDKLGYDAVCKQAQLDFWYEPTTMVSKYFSRRVLRLVQIGPDAALDKVLVVQDTDDSRVKGVQR